MHLLRVAEQRRAVVISERRAIESRQGEAGEGRKEPCGGVVRASASLCVLTLTGRVGRLELARYVTWAHAVPCA